MTEPKTRPTPMKARDWLAGIADEARRKDCASLIALMKRVTGEPPVLWGASIVGFGRYLVGYSSGKSLDWPLVGFASRGTGLVIYLMSGFAGSKPLLQRLGPHRTGKSCLYVKRLSELDREVLAELVTGSVRAMAPKRLHGTSRGARPSPAPGVAQRRTGRLRSPRQSATAGSGRKVRREKGRSGSRNT